MATKWTKAIKSVLLELCEEREEDEYSSVEQEKPLSLAYKNSTVVYHPDLYTIQKDGDRVEIFEIVDAETPGEAVMDLIQSCLVSNISCVHLVFRDAKKIKKVKEMWEFFGKALSSSEFKKTLEERPTVYIVSALLTKNRAQLKRKLEKELEFVEVTKASDD